MKASDLKPFCCDYRPRYSEPFSHGEHTYATDGKLLIRVPRIVGVEQSCPVSDEDFTRAMIVAGRPPLKTDDLTKWQKAPEIKGRSFRAVCDECAADPDYEISDDCHKCHGIGVVIEWKADSYFIDIDNRRFSTHLLRKLSALPNLELSTEVGGEHDAIYLRFDGGVGVLLPMRKD